MSEQLIKILTIPKLFTTEEFMLKDLLGKPETVQVLAYRLGLYDENVCKPAVEAKLARLGVAFETVNTVYGRLGRNGTFNAGSHKHTAAAA